MNSLVELIENKRENVTTRILKINDISLDYYKILFTPKLENTDFKYFDNQVFIELKNENFREQYDLWIISLYSKLKKQSNLEELIQQFNIEIKRHQARRLDLRRSRHVHSGRFFQRARHNSLVDVVT